ncbi:MAG: cytochrome c oxidase assembly protein [Actinomycetota bacterium]|nr:cytochrome c oxidase assembly protein [Actinomycetota bacterium]
MNLLFSHWSAPPTVLAGVLISLVLYERGLRRIDSRSGTSAAELERRKRRHTQRYAFLGGLVMVLVALASPIDYWSDVYFWVHMIQHMILLLVIPPLVLLGAPWMPMLRGLPVPASRAILRWIYRSGGGRLLRRTGRVLGHPLVAVAAFDGTIFFWHVPAMFDATLRIPVLHYTEHVTFIVAGLWLWGQLIGSHPFSPRLEYFSRIWVIAGVLFPNWGLVIGMGYAGHPWYGAYASVPGRGISLMNDQGLAAAIMWVTPMIPFGITAFWTLNKWLSKDADEDEQLAELLYRARLEARTTGLSGHGAP